MESEIEGEKYAKRKFQSLKKGDPKKLEGAKRKPRRKLSNQFVAEQRAIAFGLTRIGKLSPM